MPEKTKPEKDTRKQKKKEDGKPLAETEAAGEAAWEKDQREKSYYYDDSHGYEIYDPDEDEADD